MTNAGEQAGERATPAPRLVIDLGGPVTSRGACRVEAPGRVLRMWAVLSATDGELHQPALPPAVLPRLQRSLRAVRTELERSVSAPLADELCTLLRPQAPCPGRDELRIECASLLGWTVGLVLGILDQVEAAAVATALPAPLAAQPGSSPRTPAVRGQGA
jgi:Protein of unknown function (DUF2587)